MGLTQKSSTRTFIKIGGLKKGSDKVYFTTSKKGDDGKWGNEGEYSGISGYFRGFQITDKEFDGNKYKEIQINLSDAGDDYCLSGSLGSKMFQGIANSLAGSSPLGYLEFSIGFNKKGYPACWIKNGGENTDWAISWEEQKELVDVITNKKGEFVSRDDSELVEALVKKLLEVEMVEGNLIDSIPSTQVEQMNKVADKVVAEKVEEESDEDLPW